MATCTVHAPAEGLASCAERAEGSRGSAGMAPSAGSLRGVPIWLVWKAGGVLRARERSRNRLVITHVQIVVRMLLAEAEIGAFSTDLWQLRECSAAYHTCSGCVWCGWNQRGRLGKVHAVAVNDSDHSVDKIR